MIVEFRASILQVTTYELVKNALAVFSFDTRDFSRVKVYLFYPF